MVRHFTMPFSVPMRTPSVFMRKPKNTPWFILTSTFFFLTELPLGGMYRTLSPKQAIFA